MSNTTNIYSRIIEFQKSMPAIKKDQTAKVKGQSKTGKDYEMSYDYADLATIQQAIQGPLATAGLGYIQKPTSDGLVTVLFDTDGNTLEYTYPAVFTGKPQEIGSAVTYAKRYSLVALLGLIIEGEDDDGNEAQKSEKQDYKKDDRPWLTQKQYEAMVQFINAGNWQQVEAKLPNYKMKKEYKEALNELIADAKNQPQQLPDPAEIADQIFEEQGQFTQV